MGNKFYKGRNIEEIYFKTKLFGDPDLDDIEEILEGEAESSKI